MAVYSVEDAFALAALAMSYPQARIYPLPSGRWVGHTCEGLFFTDSLDELGAHLAEVYAPLCPVVPLRPGGQ